MKFKRKTFEDKRYQRKVSRYILLTTIITILPSIYLTYDIINRSLFENAAEKFVKEQFNFDKTQVIAQSYNYDGRNSEIDLLLIGYELPQNTIDSIKKNLKKYQLENTKLTIRQGLNEKQEIDFTQIKASIMKDVFAEKMDRNESEKKMFPNLMPELKSIFPAINSYSAARIVQYSSSSKTDSITVVVADFSKPVNRTDRTKLKNWLTHRLKEDTLKLVIE